MLLLPAPVLSLTCPRLYFMPHSCLARTLPTAHGFLPLDGSHRVQENRSGRFIPNSNSWSSNPNWRSSELQIGDRIGVDSLLRMLWTQPLKIGPPPLVTSLPLFPIVTRKLELSSVEPFRYRLCPSNWSRSIAGSCGTHFDRHRHWRTSEDHRRRPPPNREATHRRHPNSSPPMLQNASGELPSSSGSCRKKSCQFSSIIEQVRTLP
jgi:hypothetical protein